MQWLKAIGLSESDIARVIASPDGECFAVTTDGTLSRAPSFDLNWQIAAEFGGRVYDLAYVPETGGVCSVGARGTVSWWDRHSVIQDRVPAPSTLRAVIKRPTRDWLIVGQDSPVAGAVFAGKQDAWQQLHLQGLAAGLRVAVMRDSKSCILAGERGFAASYDGNQLVRLQTNTRHPLRAVAATSSSIYIAGGGWAEEMPTLLRFDGGAVTELARAGGERLITGLCAIGDEVWFTENHAAAGVWNGKVCRLAGSALEPVAEFPGRLLLGIAHLTGALVVWGSKGLLAYSALG